MCVCVCVCVCVCEWGYNEDLHYKKLQNFSKISLFYASHSNLFWLSKRLIFAIPQWYLKYSRSLSAVFKDILLQYNILA